MFADQEVESTAARKRRVKREYYAKNRARVLVTNALWRAANPDKYRGYWAKARRSKTPARNLWEGAKNRAARRGLEFTLTIAWVQRRLDAGVCEVTGLRFDRELVNGKRINMRCPTIDRKDNSKGYTSDNCQLVVWQYNCAKSDGDVSDLYLLVQALALKWGIPTE